MILTETKYFDVDPSRIRVARALKGGTIVKLEEETGVMRKTISRLEKGITQKVRMDTLKKLMDALDQPVEFLMTNRDIKDVI